jgi:mRNA-degrading endonuclease HigB of HigAB toxin-antitoxin module
MDNNGNAIIVWYQYNNSSNYQVFKSEYRSDSWIHPADLDDTISMDGQHVHDPRVAMDDNGNAIIAWRQDDGSLWRIFMSEYRSGSWTHPADLNDNISPGGTSAITPKVAMDNNSEAVIVWEQLDGTKIQAFISEYRNGSWIHPADLNDNLSPDGKTVYDPQVAMDNNGNAIVVWRQSDGSNPQIFICEYR